MADENGDDPTTASKSTGIKFDGDKLRWDLLPVEPTEDVIRVLMLGSHKYGDDNWKLVPASRRRYYAASLRHLTAWWLGEKVDPESGVHHLAHAMCCLLFLIWHDDHNPKNKEKVNDSSI